MQTKAGRSFVHEAYRYQALPQDTREEFAASMEMRARPRMPPSSRLPYHSSRLHDPGCLSWSREPQLIFHDSEHEGDDEIACVRVNQYRHMDVAEECVTPARNDARHAEIGVSHDAHKSSCDIVCARMDPDKSEEKSPARETRGVSHSDDWAVSAGRGDMITSPTRQSRSVGHGMYV